MFASYFDKYKISWLV